MWGWLVRVWGKGGGDSGGVVRVLVKAAREGGVYDE
jgi:hypothetical protein